MTQPQKSKQQETPKTGYIPPERRANKSQVAAFFGVAQTTINAWILRGMPYLQRGAKGINWEFDLLDVARWHFAPSSQDDGDDPEKLPPKDRLDWYRGTRERTRHMEESGQLIPAAKFEQMFASTLKSLAVGLESLPDILERDCGIDGETIERMQSSIDRFREDLYRGLLEIKSE